MKTFILVIIFSAILAILCPFWSALIHAAVDMGHFEFGIPPVEGGDIDP